MRSGEGQWSCRHFVQGPGIWSSRQCSKRLRLLPLCAVTLSESCAGTVHAECVERHVVAIVDTVNSI